MEKISKILDNSKKLSKLKNTPVKLHNDQYCNYRNQNGSIDWERFHMERTAKHLEKFHQKNKINRINQILSDSKIPDKVKNIKFDDLIVTDKTIFDICKNVIKNRNWLYLHGANNTGKTMLLGAITNLLANNIKYVTYFNEELFFDRMKNSFEKENNDSIYKLMNLIIHSNYILWDEFSFNPYKTSFEMRTSYNILETADSMNKTIIFASNLEFCDKIIQRIGQRNYARMKRNNILIKKLLNKPFCS